MYDALRHYIEIYDEAISEHSHWNIMLSIWLSPSHSQEFNKNKVNIFYNIRQQRTVSQATTTAKTRFQHILHIFVNLF